MLQIGEGSQFQIFSHPQLDGEVLKISKEGQLRRQTPTDLIGQYYLTKVMHMLLPEFVLDVHFIGIKDGHIRIRMDRVEGSQEYKQLVELMVRSYKERLPQDSLFSLLVAFDEHTNRLKKQTDYELAMLQIRNWGMEKLFDEASDNFAISDQEKTVYVDQITPWIREHQSQGWTGTDIIKLQQEITVKLPEPQRSQALRYLARYEKFLQEKQKQTSLK